MGLADFELDFRELLLKIPHHSGQPLVAEDALDADLQLTLLAGNRAGDLKLRFFHRLNDPSCRLQQLSAHRGKEHTFTGPVKKGHPQLALDVFQLLA